MAELVDAHALGACGFVPWEFESPLEHWNFNKQGGFNMKWLTPNMVSSSRLFLAPVVLLMLCYWQTTIGFFLAAALMGFIEYTDRLDGQLARSTNQVTETGKLFDPMCDNIYHQIVFLGFLSFGWVPLWAIIVIVIREVLVAYARVFAGLRKVVLAARITGKVKTATQATAQITLVVAYCLAATGLPLPVKQIGDALLTIAALVTLVSLADYLWHVYSKVGSITASAE